MTIKEIRGILGRTRSRRHNIPARTLQDWEDGKRTPPAYIPELLERVVKEDKEKEGI